MRAGCNHDANPTRQPRAAPERDTHEPATLSDDPDS